MEPFVGQIGIMAFPFAPTGWAMCDGSVLPIAQHQALFAVLGKTYGGDGVTTFALPDLRGRAPMHAGSGFPLGASGGTETVALQWSHIPVHTHVARAAGKAGDLASPADAVWARSSGSDLQYATRTPDVSMAVHALGPVGDGQPHPNMPPVTVLNFVIALQGIFPSRT